MTPTDLPPPSLGRSGISPVALIIALVAFVLVVWATTSIVWQQSPDVTDWTAFESENCSLGTCGPEDFKSSELTYEINPSSVRPWAELFSVPIGLMLAAIAIAAVVFLVIRRTLPTHTLVLLLIVGAAAALIGRMLRAATAAQIGGIIFGGVTVFMIVVVTIVAAIACLAVHRSWRSRAD